MSDRIDELLADAAVAIHNNDRHVLLKVITDIATIAREAEAMCEWLASQLVTARIRWPHLLGCYALPARAEDVWLDAAREAVKEADSE